MATPRIDPFDPTPFIRGAGQAIGSGIAQSGQLVGEAFIKHGSPEAVKARKDYNTKKELKNQILEVESEQFDVTENVFGEPKQEKLIDTKSFESGVPAPGGDGQTSLSDEFVRSGSREVKTRDVDSKALRRKLSYMKNLERELETLSIKELKQYKMGRGFYMQRKTEFQKEWGKDALTWVDPTVQEFTDIVRLEKHMNDRIDRFVSKEANEFMEESVQAYLRRPEVQDALDAQAKGATPTNEEGTFEGFSKWLINESGAPNDDFFASGQDTGKPVPDNLNHGRWNGKKMGMLGNTETRQALKNMFDSAKSRRSDALQAQQIKSNEANRKGKSRTTKANQEQKTINARMSTFEDTTNKLASQLQSNDKSMRQLSKAITDLEQGLALDPKLADKSKEELQEELTRKQGSQIFLGQQQQVLDAIEGLKLNRKEVFNQSRIRNLTKQVFDEKPDRPGSAAFQIRQVLFPNESTGTQGANTQTSGAASRVLRNPNQTQNQVNTASDSAAQSGTGETPEQRKERIRKRIRELQTGQR